MTKVKLVLSRNRSGCRTSRNRGRLISGVKRIHSLRFPGVQHEAPHELRTVEMFLERLTHSRNLNMSKIELTTRWWNTVRPKGLKSPELDRSLACVEDSEGADRVSALAAVPGAIAKTA